MFNFIWDGKPEKIRRQTLIQDYQNGGLKMIDINKFINSLKASWVKRILDTSNSGSWRMFYLDKLNRYGGKLIFDCNLTKDDVLTKIDNGFLKDVLSSWFEINSK